MIAPHAPHPFEEVLMLTRTNLRRSAYLLLLALLVGSACRQSEPPPVSPAQMQRAQATLLPLKQQLQSELIGALDGGPLQAIEVCKVRAPEIAAALSFGDIRMGRTSHRLRNPENAPEEWMRPLLQHYVEHPEDREPRAVGIDAESYGYVEPITLRPLCTACHGKQLDSTVETLLAEHYPQDQATGFEAGDFRGMFWVRLPRNDPEDH
jgi:hypothetical protein